MSLDTDVRQQAGITPNSATVNIGIVTTAFVPQSLNRRALIISAPLTNRFTIAWGGAATLDQGITLYPGASPLVLDVGKHGGMVTGAIQAISATGAQNCNYTEIVGAIG